MSVGIDVAFADCRKRSPSDARSTPTSQIRSGSSRSLLCDPSCRGNCLRGHSKFARTGTAVLGAAENPCICWCHVRDATQAAARYNEDHVVHQRTPVGPDLQGCDRAVQCGEYPVRATSVRIRNFRGIRDLDLDLGEITVLVDQNNSGKTAVLDALQDLSPGSRTAPARGLRGARLPPCGRHRGPCVRESLSKCESTFSEQSTGEWSDELIGRLNRDNILQVDDDDRSHVMLRVTCAYDPESRDFDQQWWFLNLGGEPLAGLNERTLTGLQREVSYYYLQALRDVRHHFGAKGPFWSTVPEGRWTTRREEGRRLKGSSRK